MTSKQALTFKTAVHRFLIFATTTIIIVSFLPKEEKFNYEYDVNQPWSYNLLQAPFEFPVYRDVEAIKAEEDSVLALFQPYFYKNDTLPTKMIEQMRADISKKISNECRRHIERTLQDIYNIGILQSADLARLEDEQAIGIQIVKDNLAHDYPLYNLYTAKKAYLHLLTADTVRYPRSKLMAYDLDKYIKPNLIYDQERTEAAIADLKASISQADDVVLIEQKIIDRGELVDEKTFSILESLRSEWEKRSSTTLEKRLTIAGQLLFVGLFVFGFMVYLDLYRPEYYSKMRYLILLFGSMLLILFVASLIVKHNLTSIYLVPFTIAALVCRIFFDSRTAFLLHLTIILICSITLRYPHEFIALQTIAGMATILSIKELTKRAQLVRTAFVVFVSYSLIYLAFELIQDDDLTKLNTHMYIYFFFNCFLLLFAYPLMYMIEKLMGFTSEVTLVELSDINNPLLRRLSDEVPGTFQHSMQTASLAAEAAHDIGAKIQLVRTAALYHDIGKLMNPTYFTENQNETNPHVHKSAMESARIIIDHIDDGLALANQYKLPPIIQDFIRTHHGNGLVRYFYNTYCNEHPDQMSQVDRSQFSYAGPNPRTKEQAILMMADSVEASSRSLQEHNEESINTLVDHIIDTQVAEGFFQECPITFLDIEHIKQVFKAKLKVFYHTRVSYPKLQQPPTTADPRRSKP